MVIVELVDSQLNIEAFSAETDPIEINEVLHKLKGTAATAGLNRLAEVSAKYESELVRVELENRWKDEMLNEISRGQRLMRELLRQPLK